MPTRTAQTSKKRDMKAIRDDIRQARKSTDHILTLHINPHLPAEIWDDILRRTDPVTCLVFCRFDIAMQLQFGRFPDCSNEYIKYRPPRLSVFRPISITFFKVHYRTHTDPIELEFLIISCIQKGYLAGVQLVLACIPEYRRTPVIWNNGALWAVQYGHLTILEWMYTTCPSGFSTTGLMERAALFGHLSVVEWFHENVFEICSTGAMDNAARHGHLDVLQWLHEHRSEGCSTDAMDAAAGNGHINVVRWLHNNRTEGCTKQAMDHAVVSGHLGVVRWLHEHRTEGCSDDVMTLAAEAGELGVLVWLTDNRSEKCTMRTVAIAAHNGHWNVVQWLEDNRPESCTNHFVSHEIEFTWHQCTQTGQVYQ